MIKILGILFISFVTMLGLSIIDGQGFAWFVCGFSSLATLLLILHIAFFMVQLSKQMETEFKPAFEKALLDFYSGFSPQTHQQTDSGNEPHEAATYKRGKYRKRPATEMEVRKGGAYNADSIATEIE